MLSGCLQEALSDGNKGISSRFGDMVRKKFGEIRQLLNPDSLTGNLKAFSLYLKNQFQRSFSDDPGKSDLLALESFFSPFRGQRLVDGNYLSIDVGGTNLRATAITIKDGAVVKHSQILKNRYEEYFGETKDMEVQEFFGKLAELLKTEGVAEGEYNVGIVWANAIKKQIIHGKVVSFTLKEEGTYQKNEPMREKVVTGININESAERGFAEHGFVISAEVMNDTEAEALAAPNLDVLWIFSTGMNLARIKEHSDRPSSFVAHEAGGRSKLQTVLLSEAETEANEHDHSKLRRYLGRKISLEDLCCGNNFAYLVATNLAGLPLREGGEPRAEARRLGGKMLQTLHDEKDRGSTRYKERVSIFLSEALRARHALLQPQTEGPTQLPQFSETALTQARDIFGAEVTEQQLDQLIEVADAFMERGAHIVGASIAASLHHYLPRLNEAGTTIRVGIESSMIEHYPQYKERLLARCKELLPDHFDRIEFVPVRTVTFKNPEARGDTDAFFELSGTEAGVLHRFASRSSYPAT